MQGYFWGVAQAFTDAVRFALLSLGGAKSRVSGKAISGMRKLRLLLFARDDSICPARPNAYAFAQELILKARLELLDRALIAIRQYCVRHCLRNDAIQACLTQNRMLNRNRTIWVPSQALQGQG